LPNSTIHLYTIGVLPDQAFTVYFVLYGVFSEIFFVFGWETCICQMDSRVMMYWCYWFFLRVI
jgi:hypothetical protein